MLDFILHVKAKEFFLGLGMLFLGNLGFSRENFMLCVFPNENVFILCARNFSIW